jgi:TniQ protein
MPPKSAAAQREQRPHPRLLRSIPGGYDINRWPICVPIRPDETIQSWLMRGALRYGITPRALLATAGVDEHIDRPARFAVAVSRHTDHLAHLLGCAPDEVRAAVPRIHPNTALSDYVQRYKGLRRAVLAGSSYCPQCLAEPDPHWKRQWSNVFALACVEHSCLLVRACPYCGEAPWSTTAWLSNPENSPDRCAIRLRHGPDDRIGVGARFCNYDLRTIEVFDVDPDLVRVQQFITGLCERYFLDPDGTLTIAGVEVTSTIAFDAICELLDESLDILTLFAPGYDRTKLTRALRDCHTILSSRTVNDAARKADDSGLLNPGGPVTPIAPDNVILRRPRNPLLAAIRIHALTPSLSPTTQLMLSCGSRWPRYPIREAETDRSWQRLPEHHPGLPEPTPAWIPQVLWPNTIWYSSTAPLDIETAAQAMALAKMGDVRSWKLIALDLGLPKDMSTPVTRYWRQIVRSGRWEEALASLTALREQLRRDPPPIDYQLRRIIADDPSRLVRAIHEAGFDTSSGDQNAVHDVARRFWEHFTGGDLAYGPPPYGLPTTELQRWRTKTTEIDHSYATLFQDAYECLRRANGLRPQGPLTWRPP